jgi:hypothetical protein
MDMHDPDSDLRNLQRLLDASCRHGGKHLQQLHVFDDFEPDRWDIVGAAVCLIGALASASLRVPAEPSVWG